MATRKSKSKVPPSRSPKNAKSAKPAGKRPQLLTHHYEGPAEWLLPQLEEAYSRLGPKGEMEAAARAPKARPRAAAARGVKAGKAFASVHQEGRGEDVLSGLERTYWYDRLEEFHRRRTRVAKARRALPARPGMPAIPGANNWTPLGPSIVARGQTDNRAPVSGRISGIAIGPAGRMYVATASGGVWRSDDSGASWRSTMDSFDQNPANFASTSLACGAIAIDPANADRIYVGTGEGDTDAYFASRIVNALPAYRGIGPIRSDDGGLNWVLEASTPSLAGFSFFQIAVDPVNAEHCVAATTNGLYERVPAAGGGFEWVRRRNPSHASVVVCRAGGVTTWFAAQWGGPVASSPDGTTWTTVGTGFPAGIGRVALGAQRDNPNVLYAFIADPAGAFHSVRRLDGAAGAWVNITGAPNPLPGGSQGDYDLCIAVDPNNANRIYLGGSYFNASPFPGSVWRCDVTASGATFSMTGTSIGGQAHADVHCLLHGPGDSNTLWTGTDGGLFVSLAPTAAGAFEHRNTGLATLCTNFLTQHPLEPAVLYVGLQDNGTAKCTGEEVWRHVLFADGGYCVVNWNDPFRVLLFANGSVYRATDGGLDWGSWTSVTPAGASWVVMAAPLVGTPVNAAAPAEADVVAYAAGTIASTIVYISSDFGGTWPAASQVTLPAGSGRVFSMVFASATRLYAGTTTGQVFRIDQGAAAWTATRIDNAAGGALGLAGLVSDIAVDRSDATLASIFICFGGTGDFRHVWRYNGTAWQSRSGAAGSGTELLDVEHNAITYDAVTNRVYVGADIGAWESTDGGLTWAPLSNGLPDAPVYDLQVHPTARLLRASLHGRGVWEWKLDAPVLSDVELYVRDTMLDTGRGVNTDGRNDPSIFPTAPVYHYLSPNIKVDVPTPAGYQTPTTSIDFYTFTHVLTDGSNGVGTNSPPPTVHNRLYVEVHNRGRVDASNVQVMVAVTNAATGLALPAGYTANVVAGTPLPGPKWITLGVQVVPVVRAGFPMVVPFDLPSTVLPLPASLPGNSHWCCVAFVHALQDAFTSSIGNVDSLALADRKVGQKNLHIVEFIGAPPPPGTGIGTWAMLIVSGVGGEKKGPIDLVIDSRRFPGRIHFVLPSRLMPKKIESQAKGFEKGSAAMVKKWLDTHAKALRRLFNEAKYPEAQLKLMLEAMKQVAGQTPLVLKGGRSAALTALALGPRDEIPIFLRIEPPAGTKVGAVFEFDIQQRSSQSRRLLGGSRYRVVVNRPVKR
jgi:hypothetical protein